MAEFWDVYNSAVHEQNIPDVIKFSYLKLSVYSAAATTLSGISVTNKTYPVAVKILQDKSGKRKT